MPRVESENTLFHYMQQHFTGRSRNNLKGLLARGQVMVDGKSVTKFDYPLSPGQLVEILKDAPQPRRKMPFPIIYEDAQLVVTNKPCGLLAVSSDTEKDRTAYHMLTAAMYGELETLTKYSMRRPTGRLHVVHRLDRDTSGLLIFAKSEEIKDVLQNNWDKMVFRRGYLAVVEGRVTLDEGRVHSWLKQNQALVMYSSKTPGNGQEAITDYKVLRRSKDYSLVELSLMTGRKNQIRVHMKELGHPIAGDKKYGAQRDPIKRMALHAFALTLTHPVTGETIALETPCPAEFEKMFAEKKPSDRPQSKPKKPTKLR